jgi:hypothetical protein
MKRLLLAMLVSATAIALGPAPAASTDYYYGCLNLAYWYSEYPGGPSCGRTYIYCDTGGYYHEGCQTQYYYLQGGCACP